MKKTIAIASAALIVLAGCAPITPLSQPPDGYNGFRFRQATQIRDHAFNLYKFSAGAAFVQDRTDSGGPVYCGPAIINDDFHQAQVCLGLKDTNPLIIGPGSFKQVERTVPPGTIELYKQKL